jgi:DNA-binding XRE family transcriptional regulator
MNYRVTWNEAVAEVLALQRDDAQLGATLQAVCGPRCWAPNRLREFREARGLSAHKLTRTMKIPRETYDALEYGSASPYRPVAGGIRAVVRRLAWFYGVTPADLFP